jgi:hypothetical protein
MESGGSTVVGHKLHGPKVKCLIPAVSAVTRRIKMTLKCFKPLPAFRIIGIIGFQQFLLALVW